ncbi:hypothetical protein F0P96_13045 [Hymenobacter busanensis]|uniref:Uncharacterized protein n=1 Tax=Hymenobacter busanensis TaxID=2607656 RepID=A0A7L4ZUX4_9BACT|nr:hypothetical protein [Hymenobacter busanensis]KAA9332394.1 hypothetical protein F0P96_13045 [Hymenobacter busanensis]QHJ07269.1 hypothetical protein GUY19_08230 [Hymenobacter busanensis]
MPVPEPAPAWIISLSNASQVASAYGIIVPLGIGLGRWRSLSGPARAVVWYFAFWAVEAVLDYWTRRQHLSNAYTFHLSVLVETWLLGWAYHRALRDARLKSWLLLAQGVFTAVALADATILSGLNQTNQYARAVQVVLMLVYALAYFEQWVRELRARSPWHDFMFLVSVGLTIYYTGSVMGFLTLKPDPRFSQLVAYTTAIVINGAYLIALVLMTLALWRDGRMQPASSFRQPA